MSFYPRSCCSLDIFSFWDYILSKPSRRFCLCENRSTVCEQPACHQQPCSPPLSLLKSSLFPILMLNLNFSHSPWPCLHAYGKCVISHPCHWRMSYLFYQVIEYFMEWRGWLVEVNASIFTVQRTTRSKVYSYINISVLNPDCMLLSGEAAVWWRGVTDEPKEPFKYATVTQSWQEKLLLAVHCVN